MITNVAGTRPWAHIRTIPCRSLRISELKVEMDVAMYLTPKSTATTIAAVAKSLIITAGSTTKVKPRKNEEKRLHQERNLLLENSKLLLKRPHIHSTLSEVAQQVIVTQ